VCLPLNSVPAGKMRLSSHKGTGAAAVSDE
jgi:hypothetical protein